MWILQQEEDQLVLVQRNKFKFGKLWFCGSTPAEVQIPMVNALRLVYEKIKANLHAGPPKHCTHSLEAKAKAESACLPSWLRQ